ncbi:MAG: hypothetical protein Q9167_003775 [Letrouitia subvulpina]
MTTVSSSSGLEVVVDGLHLNDEQFEQKNIDEVLEATIEDFDLSKLPPYVYAAAILSDWVCLIDEIASQRLANSLVYGKNVHFASKMPLLRLCNDAGLHQQMDSFPTYDPPVDFNEYVWIQYLLDAGITAEDHISLHRKDIWCMWFGVPNLQDRPNLYVYPALQYLVDKAHAAREETPLEEQYPSLVSFFGHAGGGKSIIIRALIRNAALNDTNPALVPGNNAGSVDGGVRGIIELVMLRKIVAAVGFGIPIQELFDLAIGTSTGGIVALGIFKMNWSVDRAISKFEKLSQEAFSKCRWLKVPLFRNAAQLLYSHRFKSEGIEGALQNAFRQGRLYGFSEHTSSERVKVGVVASVLGSHRPYLLTNYSRDSMGQGERLRIRMRNNPVQSLDEERRAIWGDEVPPDIVLSLGTGIETNIEGETKTKDMRRKVVKNFVPNSLQGKVAVGVEVLQNILDCKRQWDEFLRSTSKEISNVSHRLNIGLNECPPHFDNVKSIHDLKKEAEDYLRPEYEKFNLYRALYLDPNYQSAHEHVMTIAKRLIAALFYFEQGSSNEDGSVFGVLHCRLSSSATHSFKQLLNAEPRFRICHHDQAKGRPTVLLAPKFDIETFSSPLQFKVVAERPVIQMKMPKWSLWEPISGYSAYQWGFRAP